MSETEKIKTREELVAEYTGHERLSIGDCLCDSCVDFKAGFTSGEKSGYERGLRDAMEKYAHAHELYEISGSPKWWNELGEELKGLLVDKVDRGRMTEQTYLLIEGGIRFVFYCFICGFIGFTVGRAISHEKRIAAIEKYIVEKDIG